MVKKMKILFLFFILIITNSCIKKEIYPINQDVLILKYKNYLEKENLPFGYDSLFKEVKLDSFNAVACSHITSLKKIDKMQSIYFYCKYVKAKTEIDSDINNEQDGSIESTNYNMDNILLFALGKIYPNDGVETLIILIEESVDSYYPFIQGRFYTIVFYNIKNNKLMSIVEVSSPNLLNKINSVTYKEDIYGFLLINYEKKSIYKESAYYYLKYYGNNKKGRKVYRHFKNIKPYKFSYCYFGIDTTGFIRLFNNVDEILFPEELR